MLYDKRWDAKVEQKTDPLSLETLVRWLESKPSDEAYAFADWQSCLLGQYFTHTMGSPKYSGDATMARSDTPLGRFYKIALGESTRVHTFGAALERARAALR